MTRRIIAVVSPFIDKQHGTERTVAECVSRLAREYDIHIYSQRVEDLDLSLVTWHRIPKLPGPHLLSYLWWFLANHLWRWSDRVFCGLKFDLIFSPGINCLDAGAILVHVVFGRLRQQVGPELKFLKNPVRSWYLILHRRLYYSLIHFLERRVYTRRNLPLAVVSGKTADDVWRFFGRKNNVLLLHIGLDFERFHPDRRAARRPDVRRELGLEPNDFAILLIGNDWKSKGLPCLIDAVGRLARPEVRLLVVGRDTPVPFQAAIEKAGLKGAVRFLPPRSDVESYYAAADVYASPTREDAFALPPAEAMACGLPVITTRNNGGAEIITQGVDGFVLEHPDDVATLAGTLRQLLNNVDYRRKIGQRAFQTAQQLSWDGSAAVMRQLFEDGIQAGRVRSHQAAGGCAMPRRRIAVVSPFIDKRHGTERRVAECISRLAGDYEFHIYSSRVEDVDLNRVVWHRIPALPGPHLFAYLWWFAANHLWRWRDRRFRGLLPALVYSPGINCFDADVVTVHVIFTEFSKQVREELRLRNNPARSWMRLIHRRLYYRLIRFLESRIYINPSLTIGAISEKISSEMRVSFGRAEKLRVIYQGIDHGLFNPQVRMARRNEMRRLLGLSEDELVLLLIGNGWKNKGLPCVLSSLTALREIPCRLLVVGTDDQAPYASVIHREGLQDRVKFLQPLADVTQFYAAADVYVGPSLYDSFAQPPMEAMACGLPVITSNRNGGSEVIANGVDGLVMRDAEDPRELADLVLSLRNDEVGRRRMGEMAAEKARSFSWEDNAAQMRQLFEHVQRQKETVNLVSSPGRAGGDA